jgi:NTP pyrophosphatase (non-canonical NTP hydrolase)
MTLTEYQELALRTAADKSKHNEFFHLVLGLVGESGEIAEKVKKLVRDNDSNLDMLNKDDIAKELGDVLWYVATLAHFLEYDLEEIGQINVTKLADRQNRGKLAGTGDNR